MSAGEKDALGAPGVDVNGLEKDLERLAVPERSLFEDADTTPAALLGTHRANPLSVIVEAF